MITETTKAFLSKAEIEAHDDCCVVRYHPDRCWNGYTVFSFEAGPPQTHMIEMNGTVVNFLVFLCRSRGIRA